MLNLLTTSDMISNEEMEEIVQEKSNFQVEKFQSSEARNNAVKMLNLCKKNDAGKVRIPHPKLANTWLMVTRKKAEKMSNAR